MKTQNFIGITPVIPVNAIRVKVHQVWISNFYDAELSVLVAVQNNTLDLLWGLNQVNLLDILGAKVTALFLNPVPHAGL